MKDHMLWLVVLSFLISLVFTFLSRRRTKERIRYFLLLFASFVLLSVIGGWLMQPFPL